MAHRPQMAPSQSERGRVPFRFSSGPSDWATKEVSGQCKHVLNGTRLLDFLSLLGRSAHETGISGSQQGCPAGMEHTAVLKSPAGLPSFYGK